MQSIRELSSDARDGGEELRGIAFATEALQHRQVTTREQVANGARDALADAGQAPRRTGPPRFRAGYLQLVCTVLKTRHPDLADCEGGCPRRWSAGAFYRRG
jgi:hypothetical protein